MSSLWNSVIAIVLAFSMQGLSAQEFTALACADGIDNDGDGLIDCDDPQCAGIPNDGCATCFESGISFADIVYLYTPGCPGMLPQYTDPVEALGVANFRSPPPNGRFVALGEGGILRLGFLNNLVINSGDSSPDLWVFEIGPAVEPTIIALRPHDDFTRNALISAGYPDLLGDGYHRIDTIAGSTSSLDIDAYITGYANRDLSFNAIELTDNYETVCFGSGNAGADIDAVCALSFELREICDNEEDDDGDGLVDCDDPDIQPLCCCYEDPMIEIKYEGCIGDGYEIEINDVLYNQSNPSGIEEFTTAAGCDSTLIIDLRYHSDTSYQVSYRGCTGDGYAITINEIVYDESNPIGRENMQSIYGCDSIVDIELFFGSYSDVDLEYIGCEGDGYDTIVNGVHYNELNPDGIEHMINQDGCDSTVAVFLTFLPTFQDTVYMSSCVEDSFFFTIGADIYNINNRRGSTMLQSQSGCDSLVFVELLYYPNYYIEIDTLICDQSFQLAVGQSTYSINNPSGSDTLLTENGCDSVFNVNLNFNPVDTTWIRLDRCNGDGYSVSVNNVEYNELNPSGFEVIERVDNCDSLVIVDLQFYSILRDTIEYSGCHNDGFELSINGSLYNEQNLEGEERLVSSFGCDSFVYIDLTFRPLDTIYVQYFGCENDGHSIEIDGELFDENNPIGDISLLNVDGCDSLIYVNLFYADTFYIIIDENHCINEGYSIIVNGVVYNSSNPVGVERMYSLNNCDSVVDVRLNFIEEYDTLLNYTACAGDGFEIVVNGNNYNELNPVGREVMISALGCDSIVRVELIFVMDIINDLVYEGCKGDGYFEIVNSTRYDEDNPIGQETVSLGSNCDSIININFVYSDELRGVERYVGCIGDGYETIVNGNVYNELNPLGVESLVSDRGCDSVVTVNLQFFSELTDTIRYEGCEGDLYSINIGGTLYDENNPTGIERFLSSRGCDSSVVILLDYYDNELFYSEYTGCIGDDYFEIINSVRYDENNPIGEERIARLSDCDSLIYVLFDYKECPDPCQNKAVFLPNVFTPNSDGLNDRYKPLYLSDCDVQINSWSVYNRYGGLVFNAWGDTPWDGKVDDQVVNSGVYVVVCQYTIAGVERTLAADVTVIY